MRPIRFITSVVFTQAVILLLATALPVLAQTATAQWRKVAPEAEEFTVLMPGAPEIETDQKPFGQMTVTSTSYTFVSDDGPVFLVASISGLGAFIGALPDKDRMNAYAQGFWKGFLQSALDRGLKAEATRRGDLSLSGQPGAAYDVTMGEVTGVAHVYSTKKKFYAVMVFNTPKSDARINRFLDSFTLKPQEQPIPPPPGPSGPVIVPHVNTDNSAGSQSSNAAGTRPTQPIRGGVLNGKAISLPKPIYPMEAREARVTGQVTVQILVDENGDVIEARAVSGPSLLQAAAVAAASRAKFSPTKLQGQLVKVTGVLTYNFVAQ
ncbi:MAG TPA: TonB family protein [Pyrinomonadaceae bacterium]|nr:TonB family protein [Pyrinomonadaceae bacterium]